MTIRRSLAPIFPALTLICLSATAAPAQFEAERAIGKFYSIELPRFAQRSSFGVRVERLAPGSLAMPAPLDVIPVAVPVAALTGQISELPERGRIYFTVYDAAGSVR
ncbi:MAG: hypothetical protein GWN99_06765, partial [Gemmatimonadetes bacterium]|nr:hypothetical protein [Gemmatimonadota bacterium]NIR73715.1 hypothetical protein [Candidatus Kutchimonas denitrificans]NIS00765.1 hypothetical protein [Gemmatimonadota bacterium]NIT66352.1 hypothetical protein [Gemmatimonadota bacterium]NIU51570.1 hypothetical protein [Gemmatimonadota bacterium]